MYACIYEHTCTEYMFICIYTSWNLCVYIHEITEQVYETSLILSLRHAFVYFLFGCFCFFVGVLVNFHTQLNWFPNTFLECSHIAEGACTPPSPSPTFPPLSGKNFHGDFWALSGPWSWCWSFQRVKQSQARRCDPSSLCARACFQMGCLTLPWLFPLVSCSLKSLLSPTCSPGLRLQT